MKPSVTFKDPDPLPPPPRRVVLEMSPEEARALTQLCYATIWDERTSGALAAMRLGKALGDAGFTPLSGASLVRFDEDGKLESYGRPCPEEAP